MAGGEHGVMKGADAAGLAAGIVRRRRAPGGDHHRLAADRRLAGHIHRIGGDDGGLRQPQNAGIDVRLVILWQHHLIRRQRRGDTVDQPVRRAPRGNRDQLRRIRRGKACQPRCHRRRHFRRHAVAPVVAAKQYRHRGAPRRAKPARLHVHHRALDRAKRQPVQ